MRVLVTILLFSFSVSSVADLVNDKLNAKSGISCLKEQYSIYDTKNLQTISDKVNCRQDVVVTNDNRIKNLDCPDQPIFNTFLNTQKKYQRSSSCLSSDRNQSPGIYENINCDCIAQALTNDYKEDKEKKELEFKKALKKKIQNNIGNKFKKKIQTIRDNSILLTEENKEIRTCFTHRMFKERFLRLTNLYGCSSNTDKAIERMENMFGESLGLEINKDSIEDTLEKLLDGIKDEVKFGKNSNNKSNSCFKSSADMENKFIHMKYDDKIVDLKSSFNDFIKNRNLYSPTIREEFNKYVKGKGIDLHPLLKTLSRDNLSKLLSRIDNDKSEKDLTLNDLLTGEDKDQWITALAMSGRVECMSMADELASAVCSDAELAYDDPIFIETFLEGDEDFKNKNLLDLKGLYCEKKDLHTIDDQGLLITYKNNINMDLSPENIMNKDFTKNVNSIIKDLTNGNPNKATETFLLKFLKNTSKDKTLKKNNEQFAQFQEAKKIIEITTMNYFKDQKNFYRKMSDEKKEEYKKFFKIMDSTKRNLLNKQMDSIKKISNDIYDIKKPNEEKSVFQERFVKNFKDRQYSRGLTNNLDSYHPELSDKKIESQCQEDFQNIYCSLKESFKEDVDMSCIQNIGSMTTVDIINKNFPKNKFQSICNATSLDSPQSVNYLTIKIQQKLKENPNICKELKDRDYRQAFTEANKDANMAATYFEAQTGNKNEEFEGLASNDDFTPSDEYSNSTKSEISNIDKNITSNISNTTTLENKVEVPENNSFFSKFDFFKNDNEIDKEIDITSMSTDELEQSLEDKSNSELINYIEKLESMIEEKSSEKDSLSSSNSLSKKLNPELEKLKKELEELKNKSDILKKKMTSSDTPTPSTQMKKLSPNKASVSNITPRFTKKNSSQDQANGKKGAKDSNQFSNSLPEAPSSSQAKEIPQSSGLSLSLNEQFDRILSKANNDVEEVEIQYNNETFRLEVKENIKGEMVCKFSEEELNINKVEELDEICEKYVESLKRSNRARTIASEKEKEDPKPQKQRKTFKVEDLNKVLNN